LIILLYKKYKKKQFNDQTRKNREIRIIKEDSDPIEERCRLLQRSSIGEIPPSGNRRG